MRSNSYHCDIYKSGLNFRGVIVLIAVCLGAFCGYSQRIQMPNYLPSSGAASLGEFGDVPTSLYTGRVAVSIPLATLDDGRHTIPVSLEYMGGGIKPDQHPGYVGMGWVLSCGGQITRQMRGNFSDEYTKKPTGWSGSAGFEKSGYYYQEYKKFSNWNNPVALRKEILDRVKREIFVDYECDRFSFNIPGYHGNFYLNENGEWMVQCDREVKVEFNWYDPNSFTMMYNRKEDFGPAEGINFYIGRSHNIKGFTLIGDDGTRYVFGGNKNAIEFAVPVDNQDMAQVMATTWYLTEIRYLDGRKAVFEYSRPKQEFQLQLARFYRDWYEQRQSSKYDGAYGYSLCSTQGSLIFPVYPSRVTLGNQSIGFSFDVLDKNPSGEYDYDTFFNIKYNQLDYDYQSCLRENWDLVGQRPNTFLPMLLNWHGMTNRPAYCTFPTTTVHINWRRLGRLYVHDSQSSRTYKFHYSDSPAQRLTLDSLACGYTLREGEAGIYRFEYIHPDKMPPYLSGMLDKWGYYNGVKTTMNNLDSRPVNPTLAQYGSLSKIVYPTGGYSRFEYEGNNYSKEVDDGRGGVRLNAADALGGGIRIARIYNSTSQSKDDEFLYRSFSYTDGERSSGVLLQPIKCHYEINDAVDAEGKRYRVQFRTSSSVLAFDPNLQGAPVGYSRVTENFPDGTSRVHHFTNYDNGYPDIPASVAVHSHTVYDPYTSLDQEGGLEFLTEEFSRTGKLTRSVSTIYENDRKGMNDSICQLYASSYVMAGSGNSVSVEGSAYTIRTHLMHPVRMVERVFDESGRFCETHTDIGYNKYRLPDTITTSYGGSRMFRTLFCRPEQASRSGTAEQRVPYEKMVYKHCFSPVIERVEQVLANGSAVDMFRERFEYKADNIAVPAEYREGKSVANMRTTGKYYYDSMNNIRMEERADGSFASYVWAGNDYSRLVAIVENFDMDKAYYNSVLGDGKIDDSLYSRLRNIMSEFYGALVTLLYYDNDGKVVRIEDAVGANTYYKYDIAGRVISIGDNSNRIVKLFNYNYKE